jgi:hypothetical protein
MSTRVRRRVLRFGSYDELLAEVDRLSSGPYRRAGAWSLTQNCEHLRIFMDCSMRGFGEARAPRLLRLIGPLALRVTLVRKKIPAGVRAPAPFQPAAASVDDPARIDAFRQTVRALEGFSGAFHPSPLFGRLTAEQWHRLHRIHAAHHLGFLVPVGGA